MEKRIYRSIFSVIVVVMLIVGQLTTSIPVSAIANPEKGNVAYNHIAYGDIAYGHIEELSDVIGSRLEGTPGRAAAANYIKQEFSALGYTVSSQPFSYMVKRDNQNVKITSENLIVEKKGISEKQIIVGAHYDSVGVGKGADDNGSAIGVMLEVAEKLKSTATPYSIKFIAFGGEEDNLKGSKYYVGQMTQNEIKNTVNMIVLDSLIAGNVKYVYGNFGSAGVIRDLTLKISKEMNLGITTQAGTKKYPEGTTGPFSDHVPFTNVGIPYTYFEATDWNLGALDGYTQVALEYGINGEIWHTQYDNLDYIEKTFPGRVQDHLKSYVTALTEVLSRFGK